MCEMAVVVRDKESTSEAQRMAQLRAGDVIVIVEDGHIWSVNEIENRDWRIFRLPGVAAAAMGEFTEPRRDSRDPQKVTGRRKVTLDLSGAWIRGVVGSGQVVEFTAVDRTQLLALKTTRTEGVVIL